MAIRLQVLGRVDLVGPDGQRLQAPLNQPKRLALLTYLRAKRPGGMRRRDELLAVFWAEHPVFEARTALSQSLSFLRRALGANAIVSSGKHEVGVDPAVVACDACAFETAALAGDHARALELYAGDLLSSFRLEACAAFNNWLADTRQHLRDLATTIALSVSSAALERGDWDAARDAARRALELEPHDETAACALIAALERGGRRAQALEAYECFTARLRADLKLAASGALRTAGERLRA